MMEQNQSNSRVHLFRASMLLNSRSAKIDATKGASDLNAQADRRYPRCARSAGNRKKHYTGRPYLYGLGVDYKRVTPTGK